MIICIASGGTWSSLRVRYQISHSVHFGFFPQLHPTVVFSGHSSKLKFSDCGGYQVPCRSPLPAIITLSLDSTSWVSHLRSGFLDHTGQTIPGDIYHRDESHKVLHEDKQRNPLSCLKTSE